MVGRLHTGSAPWRLASSTSAAKARSRGSSSTDSAWAMARDRLPTMLVEIDHDVAVSRRDGFLVIYHVGGDTKEQAGVARPAGDKAPDRVGHAQRTAQAANIAVSHQAGRHGRVKHRPEVVAEVERDRCDSHRRADTGCRLAGQMSGNAALERGQHLAKTPPDAPVRPTNEPLGVISAR